MENQTQLITENAIKRLAKKIAEGILERGWTASEVLSFLSNELGEEIELDRRIFTSLAQTVKNRWGFKLKNKTEQVKRVLEESYEKNIANKLDDVISTLSMAASNGNLPEVACSIGLMTLQAYKRQTESFSNPRMLSYFEILENACDVVAMEKLSLIKEAYEKTLVAENPDVLRLLSYDDLDELYESLIGGLIQISPAESEHFIKMIIILKNKMQLQARIDLDYLLDSQINGTLKEALMGFKIEQIENMSKVIRKMTKTAKYMDYRNLLVEIRKLMPQAKKMSL